MNGRLLLLLAALILALLPTLPAWANAGPHGDYAPMTDQCAVCHRTHTNDGANLLNSPVQNNDFCFTCHNGTGAGAVPIVSTHSNVDFACDVEAGFSLLCIQCHDPHGSGNLSIVKTAVWLQTGSPPITTGPVNFTARTGLYSFDDGVSDPSSRICTTCHINPANSGFPMTYHSGGANHENGQDYSGRNCTSCHRHSADNDRNTQDGFMPVGGSGGCRPNDSIVPIIDSIFPIILTTPSPTPTPTVAITTTTQTPSSTPTGTATGTAVATPSFTPSPTATIEPSYTPTPTATPTASPTQNSDSKPTPPGRGTPTPRP